MARTKRFDNGLNNGRDDKPHGAKCAPKSDHPKGFDTRDDDHGHYGAGGSRAMKKLSHRAARIYSKLIKKTEKDCYEKEAEET